MRMLISLVLVLLAAAMVTAWASASTSRKHAKHTSQSSSIAAIADASTSWAEFSARVPNLQEALSRGWQPPLR